MNWNFCYALQISEALESKPSLNKMGGVARVYDAVKSCGGVRNKRLRYFFRREDHNKPFTTNNVSIVQYDTEDDLKELDAEAIEFSLLHPTARLLHHIKEITADEIPF